MVQVRCVEVWNSGAKNLLMLDSNDIRSATLENCPGVWRVPQAVPTAFFQPAKLVCMRKTRGILVSSSIPNNRKHRNFLNLLVLESTDISNLPHRTSTKLFQTLPGHPLRVWGYKVSWFYVAITRYINVFFEIPIGSDICESMNQPTRMLTWKSTKLKNYKTFENN